MTIRTKQYQKQRTPRNTQKGAAPVAHQVEHVPYRLSPDHSNLGLNPACGPLLQLLRSISHSSLSISLYNKA